MIEFLSKWAEQICLAIVISSIIEMILPNNNNKKYIKIIIGIYVLFTIISPIAKRQNILSYSTIEKIIDSSNNKNETSTDEINQTSMDERLQELYIEELEKNIANKVEQKGYKVISCNVDAVLFGNQENQELKKINIIISKEQNNNKENNNIEKENNAIDVKQIKKVKINTGLDKILSNTNNKEEIEESKNYENEIIDIKKDLSLYYEIDTKKINIVFR